ncbi:LysR substrate-binding domain-containing protein [Clostridium sp. SY8519]|uniref:LysR substrate-binding domain-containing protein n=1 Tax=Clostridium sp. (strain SY8519) TaxID=1042156 RepID=UPI0024183392|nr:LysR substrate-binding domain-containing protein [Clostridium sp. SY8519]
MPRLSKKTSAPPIEIEVLEEGSYRVRDMICNHEADLGIVMLPVNSEGMNIYPLVEDECCLVTNDQHRLAKNAVTNLLELENEKLIIYNKNFVLYKEIKEAFGNMGIVPHIVNTSSMPSFIIKMVMLGQGISILPRPVLDATHAAFTTSRLDPKIPWRIALLESKKHYMPIAASCLKDAILNHQFNIKKIEYCIPSPECIENCTQFNS